MPDQPADPSPATPVDRSQLLTQAQVAEIFRVNPKTVARWVSRGLLQVQRVNGRGLFCRVEIEDLLRRGAVERAEP